MLGVRNGVRQVRGMLRALCAAAILSIVLPLLQGCATPTPMATPTATLTSTNSPTPSSTLTPTSTPTPTLPQDAVVNIEALNVRAGPNVLHPLLGVAYQATAVAVVGRDLDGGWLAVRLPDQTEGWLNGAYVALRKDFEQIPVLPTPSPPPAPTPTAIPMDPSLPLVLIPPVVALGDPFLVRLREPDAQSVVASFGGLELPLHRVSADSFAAVLSTDLNGAAGVIPVPLRIIDGAGQERLETGSLRVQVGGYTEEAVQVGPDRVPLLDPTLGAAEMQRLAEVWGQDGPEQLWRGRWSVPGGSLVTSPFGTYRDYNSGRLIARHTGVDLRGRHGDPVYAPAAGRVVMAEPLSVRGNVVWIDHGWGIHSGYFHLSQIAVIVGQGVDPGTYLGAIGTTGRSTAPHLHWEVRIHGVASNALQWLWRDVGQVP